MALASLPTDISGFVLSQCDGDFDRAIGIVGDTLRLLHQQKEQHEHDVFTQQLAEARAAEATTAAAETTPAVSSDFEQALAERIARTGDLRDAFLVADRYGTGTLTVTELAHAIKRSWGVDVTREQVRSLMLRFSGGDARFDYECELGRWRHRWHHADRHLPTHSLLPLRRELGGDPG